MADKAGAAWRPRSLLPPEPLPNMLRTSSMLCAVAALLTATDALAQATLTPLPGFGTGGWIAPGTYPFLGTANNERGLAYNPTTGNLLLVSRTAPTSIQVLSGVTGANLATPFDMTGITGGTFVVSMIDVGDDGAIYVANLATTAALPFKVYAWAAEALGPATPATLAYTSTGLLPRVGDSFAVRGLYPSGKFAASGSATTGNSQFLVGTVDATNAGTAFTSVGGTTLTSNDYRLGLTFVDDDTLIGNQGSAGGPARMTTFDTSVPSATVDASINVGGAARRPLDYTTILGRPVLALIDSNNSQVTVLDISVPAAPKVLAQGNNTTGTLAANGNGVGSVCWGPVIGNTAVLYAMSTNQGIQAFQFTVAPLASTATFGTGCDGLGLAAVGLPVIGNTNFSLDVTNVPVVSPIGFVGIGYTAIPGGIDLTADGMPGCFLYNLLEIGVFNGGPVVSGTSNFLLGIPNTPSLANALISTQGASLSLATPLGYASSNGLNFVIGY